MTTEQVKQLEEELGWGYDTRPKVDEPIPFDVPFTEGKGTGSIESYKIGMEFLRDMETVEDWGCGYAFAETFKGPKTEYCGIDGCATEWADRIEDLRKYKSKVDGIFMRHVLEHNPDWRTILQNAVESFQKRMALVFFIPFSRVSYDKTPDIDLYNITFIEADILLFFKGMKVEKITIPGETIFLIEKP